MVFRLQPRKQTPEGGLGRSSIAKGKETSLQKVAHQNYVSGFFDSQGLIHQEFVPTRQTVDANIYKDILDRLIRRIIHIHPDLCASSDRFLQHVNTPAHNVASVCQFLAKKNVTALHHLSYLPNLALANYFLFPKLKLQLKRRSFEDIRTIQKNVTDVLKGIPETDFKHALEGLVERSQKCIDLNGVYI